MLMNMLTLTLASTLTLTSTEGWQSFSPAQGGMKVLMPGQPAHKPSTIDTAAGKVQMHTYTIEDASTGMGFAVILSDFAPETVAGFDLDQKNEVLEGVKKGFAEGAKATVLSDRKLRLGEHPGKDVLMQLPQADKLMRVRFFMVNERIYQIGAVGTREQVTANDGDAYLKSFRLVK